MRWRWLRNRFVVTFGGAALLAAVWNVYIVYHDDGIIKGQVVGPSGAPVPGATVRLSEKTLLVSQARGQTTTDADGRFEFKGHDMHRLYLEADKDGVGRYGPREFRLYFNGENLILGKPLQLSAEGTS
ncbi:MAG: carboxypeptidase-like regulatory domain-containing protein [Rhizobiaceae bacterium]